MLRPPPSNIGIILLSVLVFSMAFGLTLALDLWTTSMKRQEARRALQVAARRAAREPRGQDFTSRVGEILREMGHLVAPRDLVLRLQRPAARLVWSYPTEGLMPFEDRKKHVVTHFLPSDVAHSLNPQESLLPIPP